MEAIKYYYAVRENDNEQTQLIFKANTLLEARQKAMKEYKNKLLSKVNGSSIERNTAFPVCVYLVEDNGTRKYYPVTGKEAHEMGKGWQIESKVMQEQNPLNAFFEKV
ncbi:hypothetical protein [Maribellus mangrovi]|uniref:hypothetical protein n=1 Tax=Maribellus mangrovi TaxID=3133146 RepID=UPI0030ED35AE